MPRILRLVSAAAAVVLAFASACSPEPGKGTDLLVLSVPTDQRTVARGTAVRIDIRARHLAADASSETPLTGTVELTVLANADNVALGELDAASVTLDAGGAGSFVLTVCPPSSVSSADCRGGSRVVVRATLTLPGGVTLTQNAQVTVRSEQVATPCPDKATKDHCASNAACEGKTCTDGAVTGACSNRVCILPGETGNGVFRLNVSLYAGTRELVEARVPRGTEPVRIEAKVTSLATGLAAMGKKIRFEATNEIGAVGATKDVAANAGAVLDNVATDANGRAEAYFRPGDEVRGGALVVTVTDEEGLEVTRAFDVINAGTLVFAPRDGDDYYRVMGVRESGWREQNVLRFILLDSTGRPYTTSATVKFEAPSLAGAFLSPREVQLDENGEAVTTLYSNHGAGTVAVKATTTIGRDRNDKPIVLTTTSDAIAIVGAKASGRNFAVRCERVSVPALVGNDCTFMRADYNVVCTAVLGDRFNNTFGRKAEVAWSTEAALFGPPSFTVEANPNVDPTAQGALGKTSNSLRTLNARMPLDVAPINGPVDGPVYEQRTLAVDSDPCRTTGAQRTRNPRDGLNTIVVHTQGEEGFIDANGNGRYDPGEYFFDLGEPFVDVNDNNVRDSNGGFEEEFIDVNGNGVYDGPNGEWDANTTIWAVSHVLLTSTPAYALWRYDDREVGNVPWASGLVPLLPAEGALPFSVLWRDENHNAPAPSYSTYGLKMISGKGSITQFSPANPPDSYGVMSIFQVTECNATTKACQLQTRILFDQRALEQDGLYEAPATTPFSANVQASVQQDDITTIDRRGIASVPEPDPEPETP